MNHFYFFLVAVGSYKDSIADAFLVDVSFELVDKTWNKSAAIHNEIEYKVFFIWICADVSVRTYERYCLHRLSVGLGNPQM